MDILIKLLETANSLSPLAVIGLLVATILILVKNHQKVMKIENNDLHHLDLNLKEINETLQRIEIALTYIRARLNGRGDN